MTAAIQAPFTTGDAVDLSRTLWRKQILKHGTISYKGRKLVFDKAYSTDLAASFDAGEFDQVPFQLATAENSHNMLPERFEGEAKALIPTDDGLDAILELTEDGAALVKKNPRLGVSCRIVDAAKRPGRAVAHVLGTLDPRVQGMRPWQAVELSRAGEPVVDLSEAVYEEATTVPDLTEDEVARLRALLATPPPTAAVDPAGGGEAFDPDVEAAIAALLADPANQPVTAGVGGPELSAETLAAIELAQTVANEGAVELAAIRSELNSERYLREAAAYRAAGVPPHLVELARPLLEGSHVVDLANGQKTDAGAVIRAVLDECKGQIDLSGEHGGSFPHTTRPDEDAAAASMVERFKKEYGGAR